MSEMFEDMLSAEVLTPTWTYEAQFGPLTSPLACAGDKLIGVADSTVFAIDIHNGQLARTPKEGKGGWVFQLQDRYGAAPRVTACDGVVYLMDGEKLLALRLADASPLPNWKAPKLGKASSLIAHRGVVMAVYLDPNKGASKVAGFVAATGAKAFEPVEISRRSPGPAGYSEDAVFFAAGGKLHGINLRSGDTRWTFALEDDKITSVVAPCAAKSVVLASGRCLYGIDINSGTKRFRIEPGAAGNVDWHTPAIHVPSTVHSATKAVNLRAARPQAGVQGLLRADAEADAQAANLSAGVAVVANSQGDLICLSLADGGVQWSRKLNSPGEPNIIDGVVHIKTHEGRQLERFKVENGNAAGVAYTLPSLPSTQPAVITNGTLFLPDEAGNIAARPYSATQAAAYFDGAASMIDIRPDGDQFDFGERNFTVEAWFRSSAGGEILCGYPTTKNPNAHGFRLNLTPDGQIRVAIFSADGTRHSTGRTNATGACDGNWHHVALVRRADTYLIVLDGIAQEVRLPEIDGDKRLSIGGNAALVIGAFVPEQGAKASGFFSGLIREVRLWNCAMEAALIETNRKTALSGAEPQLLGLWRLDEVHSPGDKQPIQPHNAASRHRVRAQFVNRASRPSDLSMDRSAFPYLLRESAKQWPYANTWGARGQSQVVGSPALSTNGIVAFSTGSVLYAVGAQDGRRKWSMDIASRTSDPVAEGAGFLLLTQDDSLVHIDARSGAKIQLPAFAGMRHNHDEALPAPATDANYIAAATGDGRASVVICTRDADAGIEIPLPGTPVRLAFCNAGLLVLTQADGNFTLHLVDCKTGKVSGRRRIAADAFCAAGSWIFAVADGAMQKLAASDIGGAPLTVSAELGCAVTGLAASLDDDLLAIGTEAGKVLGFSLSELAPVWSTALPIGRTGGTWNAINRPVFDQASRIICTTSSGTIAALSGETGSLLGLYHAENGAIGTPAVHAGTVYTGCRDTIANALDFELDGAMHSIVFGDTMALRLNLDRHGNPIADGKQHAVIDTNTEGATLHLMEVHRSCVEAWVNVPRLTGDAAARVGGGIVGIVPTEESGFDINLWMESDGTVHYASRAKEEGGWSGVHVKAATKITDGRWHHLAVSRRLAAPNEKAGAPDHIILYVDGVAVPVEHLSAPAAPRVAASGLKAYVGATVAEDLGAARPFCGMIAEVRVWDTYRAAPEIASRMQVKLRGDEPDLLAYWNFDYQAVHDSALQGHSGQLAQALTADAPAWWLTDLPFSVPNYPHITTAASVSRVEADDTPVYALTAKVCAADGSGMAGKRVEMWYILRKPSDPASIWINGTEVQGVKPGTEPDPVLLAAKAARVFSAVTGADGTLKLTVVSSQRGHGPSLDLWTSFMPVNERFHVNVLIDNQKLAKPAPPTLTAQAKLLQDYHYTRGDKVDHKKDRSTWRIVLRARESNDVIRPREPITLWTSTTATIEVNGARHTVNSERSVTLDAELNGEMTVVMEANELTAPTLYARAGFMHRNDRIVIHADQDAQQQLSTIKAEDMTKARVTNWKRPEDGGKDDKGETLLNREHHEHAGDISQAVRQVASSVKAEGDHTMLRNRISPARRKLAQLRAAENGEDVALLMAGENGTMQQPRIAAMRQDEAGGQTDRVALLRTMAGTPRIAPANPDAFRGSLGGAMGFVIKAGGTEGFSCRSLYTEEEVERERDVPTPVLGAPALLGNIFDDMWSGIKDTATNIYDGAKSIVVSVGEAVQIAVTKMVNGIKHVVHAVVATVQDALKAVAGFFEQIAVAIKKVIAFLRALFDWGAILEAQRYFRDLLRDAFKMQSKTLKDKALLKKILGVATGNPPPVPAGKGSLNGAAREGGGRDSPVIAGSDGVQANSMFEKTRTGEISSSQSNPKGVELTAPGGDPVAGIENLLIGLAGSVLDLSPGDLIAQVKKAVSGGMNAIADQLADTCSTMAEAMDAIIAILDTTIYIPFVSELYKWITGEDLSLLSLLCLGLGVFFNTLYAFVTLLVDGEARTFISDAKAHSQGGKRKEIAGPEVMLLHADTTGEEGGMAVAAVVPSTPKVWEIVYMGARALTVVCDTLADAQYYDTANTRKGRQTNFDRVYLAKVGILQGIFSAVAAGVFTFESQPAYHARLKAALGDQREVATRIESLIYLTFSILMAKSVVKIVTGALTWSDGGVEAIDTSTRFGKMKKFVKDKEYLVMVGLATASLEAILISLALYHDAVDRGLLKKLEGKTAPPAYRDLREEFVWLTFRDIVSLVPLLFEFLYTKEGVKIWGGKPISSTLYISSMLTRLAANVASIALHGVGVFKYGDPK